MSPPSPDGSQDRHAPLRALLAAQSGSHRTARSRSDASPVRAAPSHTPTRLFLSEFELRGNIAAAAHAAGCTVEQVRHWRATDAMFARDFTMAAVAHVRALEYAIKEVSVSEGIEATAAANVLATKVCYTGSDGRLDLGAWRNALRAFLDLNQPGWCLEDEPSLSRSSASRRPA